MADSHLKILVLTPDCPYPAHDGGSVMALGTIKAMAGHGDRVSLFFTTMRPVAKEHTEALREYCAEVRPYHIGRLRQALNVLFHPVEPIRTARRLSRAMQRDLDTRIRSGDFDVVLAEHQTMAAYLRPWHHSYVKWVVRFQSLSFKAFARTAAHSDFGFEKILNATQAITSKRFERRTLENRWYHELWFLVKADAEEAASLAPGIEGRTAIIPSCAEDKSGTEDAVADLDGIPSGAKVVLFLGSMLNPSNQDGARWLARSILPRVRERVPEAMLVVVGRHAEACLPDIPGPHVRVVGDAPDLRPYLRRCDVYAVAERGEDGVHVSGIHMKLIDGLSAAKVVVASPVGTGGVDALIAGKHYVMARDEDEFVKAVTSVLENPAQYRGMAEEGYEYFLEHLSPQAVGRATNARLAALAHRGEEDGP